MRKIISTVLAATVAVSALGLAGCARTTTDVADGKTQHPNGVVYYDANGKLQQANKEAFSPKVQDGAETFATTVGLAAGIGGAIVGGLALGQ